MISLADQPNLEDMFTHFGKPNLTVKRDGITHFTFTGELHGRLSSFEVFARSRSLASRLALLQRLSG